MTDARTLLHLQNLDVEIETTEAAIADADAHLGESPELIAAREARDSAHKALDDLRGKQRELEYEVESLTTRIGAEEKQMYDGRGRGSRELEGLRKSVAVLKTHRSETEDRILDTMGAIEQAQVEVSAQDTAFGKAEADWRASQGDLATKREALAAQLVKCRSQREQLAATIDRATRARYDDLRQQKRGRAVALIERNTCQGCRISLPLSVVQHVRANRDLVPCPSCERILVAER